MSYTFFVVQIAIKAFHNDPTRKQLHEIIAGSGAEQTLFEKRAFWKRLCGVLGENMPVFELGTWDLVRGDKASEEFESWSSELEGSIATEAEEMGPEADQATRLSAEKNYVVVTILFLVEEGSNSDDTLGERCDIPESDYFTRQTFGHLVATIPLLNFANVQADAVYLAPGSEEDGLSWEDLHGPGWEYLKPLS